MKYLFILLLVLIVIWAVKRTRVGKPTQSSPTEKPSPTEMVACSHCGIHLPHAEAVSGQKGAYCSTEHRNAAQDSNPS
jgi:uncharacterized protein